MSYRKKDEVRLAYMENEKRVKLEGRLILDRILNEALSEMAAQFDEALSRGEVLRIGGSAEEMRGFLRAAADKHLRLTSASPK